MPQSKGAMPEGPASPNAIAKGATAVDPKGWVRSFDEQGEFIQSEVLIMINAITDYSPNARGQPELLTPLQAFQLMRMFRLAGAVTANGIKWRVLGQTLELVAAACSAAVPVLVGLQTQFSKDDQAVLFWVINLLSIILSLIATVCVAMERVRGFKEQGVIERMEGMDTLLELKRFIGGCEPYDSNFRANFPTLTLKFTEIQHKGTSDVYYAFKSSDGQTTKEGPTDERPSTNNEQAGFQLSALAQSMAKDHGLELPGDMQAVQEQIQNTRKQLVQQVPGEISNDV